MSFLCKNYTDYVCLILMPNGQYYQWHLPVASLAKYGPKKQFKYHGHTYALDVEKVHELHGWIPWKEFNWWFPWSIFPELWFRWTHKTGLLIYREPKPVVATPTNPNSSVPVVGVQGIVQPVPPQIVEPVLHNTTGGFNLCTPRMFRGLTLSPLYKDYRKKQRFGSGKGNIWMWLLVGVILIIVMCVSTGIIKVG